MNLISELRSRLAAAIYSLPLWIKITVPYLFGLIVLFGLLTWLVSETFSRSLQERFRTQLVDEFVAASDGAFQLESRQLTSLRAISRTSGVPQALAANNAGDLDALIRPVAVNSKLALVHVLNAEGGLLYSLRDTPEGFVTDDQADFASWPIVQKVLAGESDSIGDKYVAVVETGWGAAVYTAGPVKDSEAILGVVLVGTPLNSVADEMKGRSLADVTIYTPEGRPAVTTVSGEGLPDLTKDSVSAISSGGASRLQNRIFTLGTFEYSEALGALTLRTQPSGWLVGVSLPRSLLTDNQLGAVDVSVWIAIGMAAVVLLALLGIGVARVVAAPINEVTQAMELITHGDLDVEVNEYGEDETGQLAQQFNRMARELSLREPASARPAPAPTLTIPAPPVTILDGEPPEPPHSAPDIVSQAIPSAAAPSPASVISSDDENAASRVDEISQDVSEPVIVASGAEGGAPAVSGAQEEAMGPEPPTPLMGVPDQPKPQPGGVKTLTVLCADIINSGSVFVDSDPGINSYFLKEYDRIFRDMVDERGATILQVGPERSEVVFGLPAAATTPAAARNAMRAAIILWEEVAVMNAQRATRNQPAIDVRITVHTGETEVNSSAPDDDLAESVIRGEAVQTAEAMQGHARRTEDHILISEVTVMALEDRDEFAVEACATFGEHSMPLYTIFTQNSQIDLE
jgi:class 3 adenylate cyclase/HAMP domain-containing protein